jgi:anti-sigma B factor antagonist
MVQRAAHMQITERTIEDATILDLRGTLFGPDATELLGAAIRRLVRAGRHRLVVNLADVPSIDASGLGALVDAYCVVTRNRGTLGLANVTRRLHDLIVITRLVTVFDIFDSVEDAIGRGTEAAAAPSTAAYSFVPQLSRESLGSIQRFLRHA